MQLAISSNSVVLNKIVEEAIAGAIQEATGIPACRVTVRSASLRTSEDGAWVTVDINGSVTAPTMAAVAAITNKSAK